MRRARLNRIVAPLGNSQLIGPSSQRVKITFYMAAQNPYSVSTEPLTQIGDGCCMNNTGANISLTIEEDGEIVQMPWFGWATNLMQINVLEVFE